MNYRTREKILNAMCSDDTLYVRDTGVAVKIEEYTSDQEIVEIPLIRKNSKKKRSEMCTVVFQGTPNKKCIDLSIDFSIYRNGTTQKLEFKADIELKNLSVYPFESRGAKLLYDRKKKRN